MTLTIQTILILSILSSLYLVLALLIIRHRKKIPYSITSKYSSSYSNTYQINYTYKILKCNVSEMVLDLSKFNGWEIYINSYSSIITGNNCKIVTGDNCDITIGNNCKICVGIDCNFTVGKYNKIKVNNIYNQTFNIFEGDNIIIDYADNFTEYTLSNELLTLLKLDKL